MRSSSSEERVQALATHWESQHQISEPSLSEWEFREKTFLLSVKRPRILHLSFFLCCQGNLEAEKTRLGLLRLDQRAKALGSCKWLFPLPILKTGLYLVRRRWQMQCLEVKPSLLYLISHTWLTFLSTFKTAAKNCLLRNLVLVSVKYITSSCSSMSKSLVKRNGCPSASVTKGLAINHQQNQKQEVQSRHTLCKDHRFLIETQT